MRLKRVYRPHLLCDRCAARLSEEPWIELGRRSRDANLLPDDHADALRGAGGAEARRTAQPFEVALMLSETSHVGALKSSSGRRDHVVGVHAAAAGHAQIVTLKHSEVAHDGDPRVTPAQVRHSRQRR